MKFMKQWSMVAAVAALLVLSNSMWAAPPATTTISIPDLECAGCAKKVAARLNEVPGVEKAQVDLQLKTAQVTAKAGVTISPLALWQAVEKAAKTPIKLEGPSGTFTAKPQS